MIQFAAAASVASAVSEIAGVFDSASQGDYNKRLEALRGFLSKVTGKEIQQPEFMAMLEATTQGEAYTGEWERIGLGQPSGSGMRGWRLRVAGGWIYDIGRGNPLLVLDK